MVHRATEELDSAYRDIERTGAYYEFRWPCVWPDGTRTYILLAPQPCMPWHNTSLHGALIGALVSVLKAKEGT